MRNAVTGYATDAKSYAAYESAIHSAFRGLWSGVIDVSQFHEIMRTAINRRMPEAFLEGTSEYGITSEDDWNTDEWTTIGLIIKEELLHVDSVADWIVAHNEETETPIDSIYARAQLWINRYTDVVNEGRLRAGRDEKLIWTLGPTEHCFPAGTLVETTLGLKPIEDIEIGELVLTSMGPKKVLRLFERDYRGSLVTIKTKDMLVTCTPNHPFKTPNGWVRADNLAMGDIVVVKNVDQQVYTKVTFPNSDNYESSGMEIGILRKIAGPLGCLPLCQWLKAFVTMPILAIDLNYEIPDHRIDDKLGFDDRKGLKFNFEGFKTIEEFKFEFGWLSLLYFATPFKKMFITAFSFFRMIVPVLFNFFYGCLIPHWIFLKHSFPSSPFRSFSGNVRRKRTTIPVDQVLNRTKAHPENFSYFPCCVFLTQIPDLFNDFFSYSIARRLSFFSESGNRTTSFGIISTLLRAIRPSKTMCIHNSIFHHLSTYGTRDQWSCSSLISANRGTKIKSAFTCARRIYHFFKSASARFARKLRRFFSFQFHKYSPLSLNSVTQLYNTFIQNTKVYNLEIEQEHEYFANGFLVHNCRYCAGLNGVVKRASFWRDHNVQPQKPPNNAMPKPDGCEGWGCECSLQPTEKPLSRGSLPGIPVSVWRVKSLQGLVTYLALVGAIKE